MSKKGGLGQFVNLRGGGGLGKKKREMFMKGGCYANAHYDFLITDSIAISKLSK